MQRRRQLDMSVDIPVDTSADLICTCVGDLCACLKRHVSTFFAHIAIMGRWRTRSSFGGTARPVGIIGSSTQTLILTTFIPGHCVFGCVASCTKGSGLPRASPSAAHSTSRQMSTT